MAYKSPPPCQCKQNRDVISTQRFIKVHSDVLNIFLRVDSSLMIIKAYFDAEKINGSFPLISDAVIKTLKGKK